MSGSIITVENLSKRYTIQHQLNRNEGFRHVLQEKVTAPFRALFGKNGSNDHSANPQSAIRNPQLAAPKQSKGGSEDFWALKDVTFEVKQGDVVGIIGRNGAGKSTLLKILSRITEPTEGRVRLRGRVASLLEVGTGFHPELTGRENIFLNGSILGMSKAEIRKKFDEIVAFSEVEKFLDTPVKRYSSGMYVRLAFAVAAHLEPEILIVDEVLAVGDAEFQKKCLGKMQDVSQKQGRTVLFVSHSMSAISALCNRAILLKKGSIGVTGEPTEVVGAYLGDACISENGEFDLSKHPLRSKDSSPILKKMRLCNADGKPRSELFPDWVCYVELEYELKEPLRLPRVAIAIENFQGARLMTFASYFQDKKIPELSGQGKIRCLLGKLALGAGRYMLSVSIGDKQQGMLDSIDNAAWFNVNWNNNFKSGEPYYQVYGPILRDSEWEVLMK